MLQIKIHGETPKSGKSICKTCKHAKHVTGQNCQEITFCHLFAGSSVSSGIVPFRVAECGEYHPSNMPWLHEMENMAWIVEARRRGPVGFGEGVPDMQITIEPPKNGNGNPDIAQE